MMKKLSFITMLFGLFLAGCQSQNGQPPEIHYEVQFPNAAHHEAEITMTVQNILRGPLTISMSRTSPGRYALHEFAKNVYEVSAVDGNGAPLEVERPDLHNWEVKGHDGTIKFSYTLYANHADGTYSGINEEHAHLNMPATFAWTPGLPNTPVTVSFEPPENSSWKVATQLQQAETPFTYRAPDYGYFLDSPTELSDFDVNEWAAPSDTTSQTISMAVHHNGDRKDLERYAEMARKVVEEQVAIFGAPADFDYGTYTFIADYLPYVYGDGMEHRNSTLLTSRTPLAGEGAMQNLTTLAHEFFHSWNVERMRPHSLEPFHFMEANVSGALWFAEGFTSYYDDLTIRRAGLTSNKKYAADWTGTLNYVLNAVGNQYYNPIEMSMQAPFVDAATSVDDQNKENTFISYYSWGAVIGLGLDLTLRSTFEEISLDDYMRALWQKYRTTGNPYTLANLEQTLAEVTDSSRFAETFFKKYIRGGQQVELQPLLAKAGFVLQKAHPGKAAISFGSSKISYEKGEATVTGNTLKGSPLYKAGIDVGDTIHALEGQQIENARDMRRLLGSHAPGEKLTISYASAGDTYESTIRLGEDPTMEVLTFEQAGKTLTGEVKEFRQRWLGSKAGEPH